jgi:hypothetical protein
MELIQNGDDYPAGKEEDWAVCYYPDETRWFFSRVPDEATAKAEFRTLAGALNVWRTILSKGPNAGRASAVAWAAKCFGGTDWRAVVSTEGFRQEHPDE